MNLLLSVLSWSPSWVTARRRWSIGDSGSTHSQEVEVELYKEVEEVDKVEEGKEEVDKAELQRERVCGIIPMGTMTT